MNNQPTIIELEAQISALRKQLKNIAEEKEKLNTQVIELKNENKNLLELLKLSKKNMYATIVIKKASTVIL